MKVNFSQDSNKTNLVLLDGISGSGKTLLSKVLDTYKSNSLPKFAYNIEQLCIASHLNWLDFDKAKELLNLQINQIWYDQSIGREVNFRNGDLSSALSSTKRVDYLLQTFALREMRRPPENSVLVVHQLLNTADILKSLFQRQMTHVVCYRHPFYLFNHWLTSVNIYQKTHNNFTLMIPKPNNSTQPWFMNNYAGKDYDSATSDYDLAAIYLSHLTIEGLNLLAKQEQDNPKFIAIDFEGFVLNPNTYMRKLDRIFNESPVKMKTTLRNEKVPRGHINDGRKRKIYTRYLSGKLTTELSQAKHYHFLREEIMNLVTPKVFAELEDSANQYEQVFGVWF